MVTRLLASPGGCRDATLALARELSGRCEVEVHTFNTEKATSADPFVEPATASREGDGH